MEKRPPIFDPKALTVALSHQPSPQKVFKEVLQKARKDLYEYVEHPIPMELILEAHSIFMDDFLRFLWKYTHLPEENILLIAAGGYGRRELQPFSDIDIFILSKNTDLPSQSLEHFISLLWDAGLKVSQYISSLEDCLTLAKTDLNLFTSLLNNFYIIGDKSLFNTLQKALFEKKIWSSQEFFMAKMKEQEERQERFGKTSYNLEPNIKEGPGGLRDIQSISWITQYHFYTKTLQDLLPLNFLTESECKILIFHQSFLWQVRFHLHLLAKRKEDRLLFDYQKPLSKQFGYVDNESSLAIEQFMKRYYRTIKELNAINDMLLQLFREKILQLNHTEIVTRINERFQIRNLYLEITYDKVFEDEPSALLELFYVFTKNPQLKGVSATTIRSVRQHLYLIDDEFRQKPENQALFLSLLKLPLSLTRTLRRMNRYGILAKYIPDFAHVVGQMQYDLFHIYTVDQHLLTLLDNLYNFSQENGKEKFPLCHDLIKTFQDYSLLYIAGLFHDIGKGKGGDHSEIGGKSIEEFARLHQLSQEDVVLLTWLVENHLIMSNTAQRMDIYDPEVIEQFAKQVETPHRLNCLYLLTVADICATNPSLWNSWKDSLLRNLYNSTQEFLLHEERLEITSKVEQIKKNVIKHLTQQDSPISEETITRLWKDWNNHYFLHNTASAILRHVVAILHHENPEEPLVDIAVETYLGGTEVFIYTQDVPHLFANVTAQMDKLQLNIVSADIFTTPQGQVLDTFIVIDENGFAITDEEKLHALKNLLVLQLKPGVKILHPSKRVLSRRLKHFSYPTRISFKEDTKHQRTIMNLITPDRPGLLATLGFTFMNENIVLENAKIVTLGERVEDVFYITNKNNTPLTLPEQESLEKRLLSYLDKTT